MCLARSAGRICCNCLACNSIRDYSWMKLTMISRPVLAITIIVLSASASFADARGDARTQVDFGIDVAQRGLWREAIYRWEKAVELDPTYAAAYNDLAVAYEHEG